LYILGSAEGALCSLPVELLDLLGTELGGLALPTTMLVAANLHNTPCPVPGNPLLQRNVVNAD
jgi:hypothetical protein